MKIRQNIIWAISLSIANVYALRDISSIDLVKDIRLGWNLGNTLDTNCENSLDYDNDPTAFETCWGNPVTTENIFNTLINHGFNLFRIPITWFGHFGEAPNYIIDHKWLSRVHEIVDYSYQNGAYVIINSSFDIWNDTYPRNIDNAKEITTKLWEQIAEEFKEYDEHLIFENINSPNKKNFKEEGDEESWEFINTINQIFINTIRKGEGNNPNRHLLIAPYAAMIQENSIKNFHIPTTDNKIMISLHDFTPYDFTHGKNPKFIDTKSVDKIMKLIKNEFLSKNIAVIITEFGATANDNENERIKWADYFITKASNLGIPCTLWDNGIIDKGKESYGIIDRTTYSILYEDYINSLLEGSYSLIDNNNREELKKEKIKNKKIDKKNTKKSENCSVNKREELNSNIKIDPYIPTEGEESENSKIIFSATNIMKPLNNTIINEKNKDKEVNEKNIKTSKSSSLNKREEPNSNIKIDPYIPAEGEELENSKIIFSTTNIMKPLNNTIIIEKNKVKEVDEKNIKTSKSSSLNKREEPNSNIKIDPYIPTEGEESENSKIIFSATNIMKPLNNTIINNEKNKDKEVDEKNIKTSKSSSLNKREESNSNIKIDPYIPAEGEELENNKIIFNATNIMKPLNNTIVIEKNKDKEVDEKNMKTSKSSSLNKREEPNSNIKIEPYTATEGEELETSKIIFSATNVMIALNDTKKEENNENNNETNSGATMKYGIISICWFTMIFLCLTLIKVLK